jgi:hypothetical protein
MNRFVLVASRRSKLLPRGGNVPMALANELAPKLANALRSARNCMTVDMSNEAWCLWDRCYKALVTRPPGLVGVLTARAAPMVRRFALVYALMDERPVVELEHLRAALEVWRYGERSARWVFGDRFGDRIADDCFALLLGAGDQGLTRTELREELGHHVSAARVTNALMLLRSAGVARLVRLKTGGRPTEQWYAISRNHR